MMFTKRNHTANATSYAVASCPCAYSENHSACACTSMHTAMTMDTVLVSIFVALISIISLISLLGIISLLGLLIIAAYTFLKDIRPGLSFVRY